jgi:RNA polymerase sigma factor (sigma-70 family)
MMQPTIFVIDDDPSISKGISRLVRSAGFNVEMYTSARDFLDSGKTDGPGCIILDVRMPEMTGPELQEKLSKTEYSMPIIFLSAHGDVPITAQAMKKGAVDFLTKPVDRDDLLEAIRISLAKDAEKEVERIENNSLREYFKRLTPREHEIMTYVITGMLNKQIAFELNISEETVKVHRGRVMQKLEIVSVAELVRLCEKGGISPSTNRS